MHSVFLNLEVLFTDPITARMKLQLPFIVLVIKYLINRTKSRDLKLNNYRKTLGSMTKMWQF